MYRIIKNIPCLLFLAFFEFQDLSLLTVSARSLLYAVFPPVLGGGGESSEDF